MKTAVLLSLLNAGLTMTTSSFAANTPKTEVELSQNNALLVKQAEQCTSVEERLERLRCFDRIFKTPFHDQALSISKIMPVSWNRAVNSAKNANHEMSIDFKGKLDDRDGDAWITLTAEPTDKNSKVVKEGRAVLMLSCIDKLSRLELALPEEIPEGRVRISLVGYSSQHWRSDDSGYLLSSSRGLPAIEMMKNMASQRRSVFRSNSKSIDGLVFNSEGLSDAVSILRQRCRW